VVAAVLATIYLLVDPPSADLAAQTYRTDLYEHAGFVVFDLGWYGGHHNPAYSILFPPLAAALTPQVVGALAAVLSAWAFERLVAVRGGAGARPAALWFATATMVSLVTGRLTFALGVALALLAVLALARDRLVWSAIAGAAAALASPVAVAFLALVLAAWGITRRRYLAAAALLGASLAPAAALSLLFPEGGSFPFTPSAFWPTLAGTLLIIAVLWRSAPRMLRLGLVFYALLLVVSAVLSTPMGGNAVRLGALFAGPIAALLLWPDRRQTLALVALPFLYWQISAPVDDVYRASRDDSVHASYYDGMLGFLKARQEREGPLRIEIPFTDNHWESARVAPTVPLARGWERQLDRKVNRLFYDDRPLTPERYRTWLDDNAVRYVALADAPVDYSAAEEAALVRRVPSFLREVWRDGHWRVFAVRDPAPLASGGARVTRMDADAVDLAVPRAGDYVIRVRFTPYWQAQEAGACAGPAAGEEGWTNVHAVRAGPIRLRAGFALGRIRATTARCTN
jgi:hypothetical protein